MKLQQLKIHNIASIEDAFIDFEAEPLANSEVFLITGTLYALLFTAILHDLKVNILVTTL